MRIGSFPAVTGKQAEKEKCLSSCEVESLTVQRLED